MTTRHKRSFLKACRAVGCSAKTRDIFDVGFAKVRLCGRCRGLNPLPPLKPHEPPGVAEASER